MSKAPEEGVSRWQQRNAAKAHMYATSNEQQGGGSSSISSRRMMASAVSSSQ